MRFILHYPDNITGGLLLFGIAIAIGITELYFMRKAYQARGVIGQGIKHSQAQRDSSIRLCKQFGGIWNKSCCLRPKRTLPRGVPKCSR